MNNIKYENSLIIEGFDFYKKWSDKPSYILTYENPVIINADDFETLTKSTKSESFSIVEKKDKFDKNDIVYED